MKKIFYSVMILSLALAVSCKKEKPDDENEVLEEEEVLEEKISVENIILSKSSALMYVGDTLRLVPTLHPANATNDTISWESSDTTVAIVENGLVTAKWFGQTTITVTTKDGNKTATCAITADFNAGEQPMFTIDDVQYAYPAPNQQYFLKGEHPNGFIKLARNYNYLFTGTSTFKARLRTGTNETEMNTTWNANDYSMSWTQPDLTNNTLYTFELVNVSGSNEESVILSYDFRTSMFNTFAEKMAQLTVNQSKTVPLTSNIFIWVVFGYMTTGEGFDEPDLVGTDYTQNKPLIVVRSAMTDDYYLNKIKPLLYDNYPFDGVVTYSRKEGQSIIPDWHIVKDWAYNYGTLVHFPWVHYLARTYYQDYQDAQKQIAAASETVREKYKYILTSGFPILQSSDNYDLNFAYTLPNGVVTDTTVQKTFVLP